MLLTDSLAGYAILIVAGAIASAINAVAGGGTLITFPTLTVGFGLPAREANATNSVGLWPGSLASAFGFLDLLPLVKKTIWLLLVPTVAGSCAGALLLGSTGKRTFDLLVPALILTATLLLAFQDRVKAFAASRGREFHPATAFVAQLLVSIYGGYFGAGMGIMMLGAFAVTIGGTIHEMNTVKNWLAVAINVVATVVFFLQGLVLFVPAAMLAFGSVIGGYFAARYSQKVDAKWLRHGIVAYGLVMCAFFAWRAAV